MKKVLLLLLFTLSTVWSQQITGFTLFDAELDEEISVLGEVVDLSGLPSMLTIRVDVVDPNFDIEYVVVNLNDGATVRREGAPPYFLGGNSDGDPFAVNAIKTLGIHSIQATAYQGETELDDLIMEFRVINSTISETESSTAAPLPESDADAYPIASNGEISGELKKWHKITIGFSGRVTSERNNVIHPFLDYRLDVEFTHPATGKKYLVPGYYACDGNAANTGAQSGSAYLVHFRPDQVGTWEWSASFLEGPNVAIDKSVGVSAAFFDGARGSFEVKESDKVEPDLRAKGRLQYVGERYLRFNETGEYFIKAGADSPENFLAYEDFDNTPNNGNWRKSWEPHLIDFEEGDPTWSNGKGRGIIGAVNYLSNAGANVFSFLPMNIQGDDKNVFPFISDADADFDRYDCSKMAQWGIVFDHASSKGMFLHFKTQETENDELLDGGELGVDRKLYYRELIAHFGHHLALNWNLGEENTNTEAQRKAFADYFKEVDPYDHPVVMHTYPGAYDNYEALLGYPTFDGVSLQANPVDGNMLTLEWLDKSKQNGRQWIVAFDEQGPADDGVVPDSVDPSHHLIRKNVLWGNLMAGGWGVEYYFGYGYDHSDLTCQDFRSRAYMWFQSRAALNFFAKVPFWNMSPANELASGSNFVLISKADAIAVLYLPNGGNATTLDLSMVRSGMYTIYWYDPREGGSLMVGSVASVQSGSSVSIGNAPYGFDMDWAVILCLDCGTVTGPPSPSGTTDPPSPSGTSGPPSSSSTTGPPSPTAPTGTPCLDCETVTGPPSPSGTTGPPSSSGTTGPPSPTAPTGTPSASSGSLVQLPFLLAFFGLF